MKKTRYKDLEDLLFVGFIPYKVRIGNLDFVFKSINETEYRSTSLMSGIKEDPTYNSKFHYNFLFHSLYMVNGVNILANRDSFYEGIISIFRDMPPPLIKRLFDVTAKLTSRVDKCTKLVESYSYEDSSRYYWGSRKNTQLNNHAYTGVRGTENLGLNQSPKYP